MTTESAAIMRWQYFLYNHGNAKEILTNIYPEYLANHFYEKFAYFSEVHKSTVMGWTELYMEMSHQNQILLSEWVNNNYDGMNRTISRLMNED